MQTPQSDLREIAGRFLLGGPVRDVYPFGSGLINATWLCSVGAGTGRDRFILQRINREVFPRPDLVMENIAVVTGHILCRLRAEGFEDPEGRTPVLVPARDGRAFCVDEQGAYWRLFRYLEQGEVFDTVQGTDHAFEVGRALGRFQTLLADLSVDRLHDTLPNFHHTPRYLQELRDAVRSAAAGRRSDTDHELAFIEARAPLASELTEPMENGRIPVRIVHNDPKVNNVLVRRDTGKAICMLDLDTVKPGIIPVDFGDCVRSAANPAGEDAPDPASIRFDRDCYEAIRAGYLEQAGPMLSRAEIDLLPRSVRVITFELGIRFLADHLRGDTYFRTHYPGQNLHRARVQLRLLERIEAAGV